MTTQCVDCQYALKSIWHGFHAFCPGCQARMMSRSPDFKLSKAANHQYESYRQALKMTRLTHEQVKKAWIKDFINKGKA